VKKDRIARGVFVAAGTFLVFLLGFACSHFRLFPHGFLSRALNHARALVRGTSIPHQAHPVRHDLVGVAAYDERGRLAPEAIEVKAGEFVLLSSYWPELDWKPGVRLVDRAGHIVHTWDLTEAMSLWPGRTSVLGGDVGFTYVHGSHLFENGDVLLVIEYIGLVRLSASGKVVWKLDRHCHHAIHQADDGKFWVCEARLIESRDEITRRFRGLLPPLVEDRVLELSPNGEILTEISVLELVYHSDQRNRLLSFPIGAGGSWDVLHLNDVEPLPKQIASSYPTFEAGDLMVSMRDTSTIMVFDPRARKVKWTFTGPVLRQHDPDFVGDGWISVFDNNSDETAAGEAFGGSRLILVRPETGERRQIYPGPGPASGHERPFYSFLGGKSQRLSNGHWLVTEATAGRVFEIDAEGRTRWEWGQEPHEKMVFEVLEGTRYDLNPHVVQMWAGRR
jgi:outer membrane protein assembly factor BamB